MIKHCKGEIRALNCALVYSKGTQLFYVLQFVYLQEEDESSDDEDDTAALLAELQKIKKERSREKARLVSKILVLQKRLCILYALSSSIMYLCDKVSVV